MIYNLTATILMLTAALTLILTIHFRPAPLLIWNASPSVRIGLYHLQSADHLSVTDLVVVAPAQPLAGFLAERGYLPAGVLLIKHILALPGQTVCRNDLTIILDGIVMGAARERDHRGRELPTWDGCRVIGEGEVFLMNSDEPASLDGRYFGPISASTIIGRAQPLWTFEEH